MIRPLKKIFGGEERPEASGAPNSNKPGVRTASSAHADILSDLKGDLAAVSQNVHTIESIDIQIDLLESGYLDSLSMVDFLVRVEKRYSLSVPSWELGGRLNTLEALAGFIATNDRRSP